MTLFNFLRISLIRKILYFITLQNVKDFVHLFKKLSSFSFNFKLTPKFDSKIIQFKYATILLFLILFK